MDNTDSLVVFAGDEFLCAKPPLTNTHLQHPLLQAGDELGSL